MRIRFAPLSWLIAGILSVCGCATAPSADIEKRAAAVQVYEMDPYRFFIPKPYDVVGRIWSDSRRTAFSIPTYPTKEAAIAAMQTEAARLDANALISVSCTDQHGSTWVRGNEPAFICYGVAIQVRQS
jgi:hypothetical protein